MYQKILSRHLIAISRLFNPILRALIRAQLSRKWLNFAYMHASDRNKQLFWRFSSKIFRNVNAGRFEKGVWRIPFGQVIIFYPLEPAQAWRDWDTAVSLAGHDIEVKITYRNILYSDIECDLFIDAGANYGTHALIFRKHNVKTFVFEPNPECLRVIKRNCRENGVEESASPVALGSTERLVNLSYKPTQTWTGRVVENVMYGSGDTRYAEVWQKRLDDYVKPNEYRQILLKIDVEGKELDVMRGAIRLLTEANVLVIFETQKIEIKREKLFDFLEEVRYCVQKLPFSPQAISEPLSREDFCGSENINFIAIPISYIRYDEN